MEEIRTDVVVAGTGGAGLRAAIAAAEAGCATLLVSKGSPLLGSATLLSDGFFTTSGPGMDPAEHVRLTMETGYHLNDPALVKVLSEEAPERLAELTRHGATLVESKGGMRSPKVRMGNMPVPGILGRWAAQAGVSLMGWTTVIELLVDRGRVAGCSALVHGRPVCIRAKATVLCTGGASALFRFHDNPLTNLGDGYAIASRAGALLRDMEFIQFYPLITNEPGTPRMLIMPPLADIGRIVNDEGEDLVEKYELGSFRPLGLRARDRLSRVLFQERLAGRAVFLDLRSMAEDDWLDPAAGKALQRLFETRYNSHAKPLLIMPAAHFTIGGIPIDPQCRTNVEGLFAAGEVACGLHGANRMGGNALTETLVFGARAGAKAAEWAHSITLGKGIAPTPETKASPTRGESPLAVLKRLKEALWQYCGPVRTAQGLSTGIETLGALERAPLSCRNVFEAAFAASVKNGLHTARAIFEAAQSRRESMGAHFRTD
jgi:succinate dehydrogenase/fumarate reductase flavoprotein subunit